VVLVGRVVNLPYPDLHAVTSGESIVMFVPYRSARTGATVPLTGAGPRPRHQLAPAYRRWAEEPVPGEWSARIVEVRRAETFDAVRLAARHILASVPADHEVAAVRVFGNEGAVLSDDAFQARLRSLHSALR
jgi:hypothetical protein